MKTINKPKLLIHCLAIAYFFAVIISCKKSDNTTTPTTPPNATPFATINGSTVGSWTITADTSTKGDKIITGTCNGYIVVLDLHTSATGQLSLASGSSSNGSVNYQGYTYVSVSGSCNVTALNTANRTISGTFSFTTNTYYYTTMSVTSGTFTNVVY